MTAMAPGLQLFHSIPEQPWAIAAHFALHGCHHKFPLDASRLVFPPLPAAVVAAAAYGLLRAVLAKVSMRSTQREDQRRYFRESCMQATVDRLLPLRWTWRLCAACGVRSLRRVRGGLPAVRLPALRDARTGADAQPLAAAGTIAAGAHAPPLQVSLHSL